MAHLDGPDRDVRLLVDLRETLVNQRTQTINRLRWRLHELDSSIDPTPRSLDRASNYDKLETLIEKADNLVGRLAKRDIQDCRRLTVEINQIEEELRILTEALVPTLLEVVGCGTLTAAKLLGEAGGIDRFRSQDAFARHNGTAPLPVWSSNQQRHRLSRTGNRQINTAIHRIALTQIRVHQPAKELYERRKANGNGGLQALRVVKRHLPTPSSTPSKQTQKGQYPPTLDRGASYRPHSVSQVQGLRTVVLGKRSKSLVFRVTIVIAWTSAVPPMNVSRYGAGSGTWSAAERTATA